MNMENGGTMTKSLTEQWREGELFGFYYVKEPRDKPSIHNVSCMDWLLDEDGVEVLVKVPSYDEYLYLKTNNDHWNKEAIRISKQAIGIVLESDELVQEMHIMEKKLSIATKALESIASRMTWNEISQSKAEQALKEIEEVK